MSIFKYYIKFISLILFFTVYFLPLKAKNLDNFQKGNYISDYFSGILSLNENQYDQSYNYFRKLDGLESAHPNFSVKYLYSLVNLGKFNDAYFFSKKLEKKNLNNFESDLIIGLYYLKNEKLDLALKHFLKIKSKKVNIPINDFIIHSLINWTSFNKISLDEAERKIQEIDSRFEN